MYHARITLIFLFTLCVSVAVVPAQAQQPRAQAAELLRTARRLEQEDKTDEAIAAAKKAVALDPKYAEAHFMVGSLLKIKVKREREAIAALRTAISLDPHLVAAYEELGQLLLYTKQLKEAEAIFRKGMELDPKHQVGRFAIGRMLVERGQLKEARELWEGRASDEDNTMPSFINVLTRAENMQRAKEAIAANPDDPDALVNLGIAVMDGDHWVMDDRQKQAIVHFRKALKIQPNNARAQYQIVKAYVQLANFDETENKNVDRELARLRKLDPQLAAEMEKYRKEYVGGLITDIKPE